MAWTYMKSTLAGEVQTGPVSNEEFVDAIRAGHVKANTKVHHPQATNNDWARASSTKYFSKAKKVIQDEKLAEKKSALEQREQAYQEKARKAKAARAKAKRQTDSTSPSQPATQVLGSKIASARPVGAAEKLLFAVTRVFVLIICVLASLGLVANLIWLLSIFVWPPPSTQVSTTEIITVVNQPEPQQSVEEEKKNDDGQNASGQVAKFRFRGFWKNDLDNAFENVAVRPELVKILQDNLTDELNLTLLFSIRDLSRENKQELIDDLTAFLSANKVADKKLISATELLVREKSLLLTSRANYSTTRVTRMSLAITAVLSSLGTIALFSLVLVLLAIERNTRIPI